MRDPGAVLLYCRAGFEKEAAAEIQARATALEVPGYVRTREGSAYLLFNPLEGDAAGLASTLAFPELVFARQMLVTPGAVALAPADRITPLLAALEGLPGHYSALWVETADTTEARSRLGFCRRFARPLGQALAEAGRLDSARPGLPRLHVLMLDGESGYPALSWPGNSAAWPMGIPRLRLPRSAPSRSALKLEEAFHVFLSPAEREQRLAPGVAAVDLGAAPGGWSWLLTRRGVRVEAVDNGPLDPALLASGLVSHRREDGFRFQPRRPVDWMVCDMVERPGRIARLVALWVAEGRCRESVFNLKLPMKQRHAELSRCRELMEGILERAGVAHRLRFKQLYHDREEVTGHLQRV